MKKMIVAALISLAGVAHADTVKLCHVTEEQYTAAEFFSEKAKPANTIEHRSRAQIIDHGDAFTLTWDDADHLRTPKLIRGEDGTMTWRSKDKKVAFIMGDFRGQKAYAVANAKNFTIYGFTNCKVKK